MSIKYFKKTNIDPTFTETLKIEGEQYTLINSGTKHTGLYSVKSSIKNLDRSDAMLWMYMNAHDQAFDFFPELRGIVENAQQLKNVSDWEYEMFIKTEIWDLQELKS